MTVKETPKEKTVLPTDDPRVKMLNATIKKNKAAPDALIQVLHAAQNMYGYLSMEVIRYVAEQLKLPPSRVYGVVTFYHFFSLKPKGEHTCLVCTGTACYVKGAQGILDEMEGHFSLKPGEVSEDNQLGLQVARCLGACGLAPAVVLDEEVMARVQPEEIVRKIEEKTGVQA